jgi:drug/metabolite transporter (DMT)-like permease
LLQSATPLVMMACAFALFRDPVRPLQLLAIAVSIGGVVVIVTRGEPAALHALSLHAGDAWLLAAVLAYSLYSALLRIRPPVHPLSFLAITFGVGSVMLLPPYLWETAAVTPFRPSLGAVAAIGYLALFPGCISYLLWNRGVELIGPGRAGQYFHLLPVFGTVLAVLFLGEAFQPYHGAGIALIALGIGLATWRR